MFLNKINIKTRAIYIRAFVTIEPLICCAVIAKTLCVPALTNLHFEKACKVNAGFNATVCDAIVTGTYLKHNFREQNNIVQRFINNLRSWEVPVSSVVPVILVLFLGAYSDRHKIRKPFLIMPIIGEMVSLVGCILNVIYMSEWSLEVQAVCDNVIPSIFGSDELIIMISYAYIADISSPEARTFRMSVIPILMSVCIPLTQAVSGVLFKAVGYIPVFTGGLCLLLVALLNGIYVVKEPFENEHKSRANTLRLLRDVFDVNHVVQTFSLLAKNRGTLRNNLLCLLLLCFFHNMVNTGEYSTFFLFTQTAYQWTVVDYSYYTTLGTVINFIGLSVVLPLFTNVVHLDDLIIIMTSFVDAILVSSVFVTYTSSVGLYIGRVLAVLRPAERVATKSQLTKYVSGKDVAKALGLNTLVSAVAATVSAQVYHQGIYEHTRETFPQAFFLLGIVIHVCGVLQLIWMYFKNRTKDSTTKEEDEKDTQAKEMIAPEAHVTYI